MSFAKLRMLELYYNYFDKYCDVKEFEELEMDTDSLNPALSEHDLYDCIRPAVKEEWNLLRSGDCTDEFWANSTTNFFPRIRCAKHRKHNRREPGLFEEEFRCTEMKCLCSETYCCYDSMSNEFKFSSKGLKKRTLQESADGPMSRYCRVLLEVIILTSSKKFFRTIQHAVATYEQTKKCSSSFYPEKNV